MTCDCIIFPHCIFGRLIFPHRTFREWSHFCYRITIIVYCCYKGHNSCFLSSFTDNKAKHCIKFKLNINLGILLLRVQIAKHKNTRYIKITNQQTRNPNQLPVTNHISPTIGTLIRMLCFESPLFYKTCFNGGIFNTGV